MSKVSDAKACQEYSRERTCRYCKHFTFERYLPLWMVMENESYAKHPTSKNFQMWDINSHGEYRKLRCGIGGFAVTVSGSCKLWEKK